MLRGRGGIEAVTPGGWGRVRVGPVHVLLLPAVRGRRRPPWYGALWCTQQVDSFFLPAGLLLDLAANGRVLIKINSLGFTLK